jgi:hypothetical protein
MGRNKYRLGLQERDRINCVFAGYDYFWIF